MSEVADPSTDARESLPLKLAEPTVSTEDPWADDVLDRKQVAERLTNLVRDQSSPFVISVHGQWGTGKTFLLQRWQADLERQGYKAIYFNAWEDDFCDDPLLAILGQLSQHFKETGFKKLALSVVETAGPLVLRNIAGLVEKHIGLTADLGSDKPDQQSLLDDYLAQRATKDQLKERLGELAGSVHAKTGHPLVFIIDELDRCRPTFAIELLERVKHIFDVPNMVFVFGINRDELCSSLQSVYGEIDADVYLRRFFDMEFTLAAVGSDDFCRHLMDRFGLRECFAALSLSHHAYPPSSNYQNLHDVFVELCDRFSLSLRDIDYGVRLIALLAKNIQARHYSHFWMVSLLIALKLKSPALYHDFVQGECPASAIINLIDESARSDGPDDTSYNMLDTIEGYLYLADRRGAVSTPPAHGQLRLLRDGSPLTHPQYLSNRTKGADEERVSDLLYTIDERVRDRFPRNVVESLAELIDLHQQITRR